MTLAFRRLTQCHSETLIRSNVTWNETFIDHYLFGKVYPMYGNQIYTTNFTCGRDAEKFAPTTKTAAVVAGQEMGFRVGYSPYVGNVSFSRLLTNRLSPTLESTKGEHVNGSVDYIADSM